MLPYIRRGDLCILRNDMGEERWVLALTDGDTTDYVGVAIFDLLIPVDGPSQGAVRFVRTDFENGQSLPWVHAWLQTDTTVQILAARLRRVDGIVAEREWVLVYAADVIYRGSNASPAKVMGLGQRLTPISATGLQLRNSLRLQEPTRWLLDAATDEAAIRWDETRKNSL